MIDAISHHTLEYAVFLTSLRLLLFKYLLKNRARLIVFIKHVNVNSLT